MIHDDKFDQSATRKRIKKLESEKITLPKIPTSINMEDVLGKMEYVF